MYTGPRRDAGLGFGREPPMGKSVSITLSRAGSALVLAAFVLGAPARGARPVYRSPADVAFSPDGAMLAVSDETAGCAVFVDVATRQVAREVKLQGWCLALDAQLLYHLVPMIIRQSSTQYSLHESSCRGLPLNPRISTDEK